MKKVLIVFLLLVLSTPFTYASTGTVEEVDLNAADETMTIKELHDNIKDLKLANQSLMLKWDQFGTENGTISNFIKSDLAQADIQAIEGYLNDYFSKKESIDAQIKVAQDEVVVGTLRNDLIKAKLDLYKNLTTYIKIESLKDYLEYIKSNIEVIKEDREIKDDIIRKEEILDKKVEAIKEKIETNNKLLDEKIKLLVSQKIEEKINSLLTHPKFVPLTNIQKKTVFEATLNKITAKKEALKNIHDKTSIVEKKIELYVIVEEKLKAIILQY